MRKIKIHNKTRESSKLSKQNNNLPIFIVAILGMFTISAVGLLHTNVKEFISIIQPAVTDIQLSLYDTVLYLSYLIFGVLTGLISDKIGKRKLFILVGSSGSAIFSGLLTIAPNYATLLVFRFFQGTFTVFVWQIFMTLILDVSTTSNRGKNVGIFGTFLAMSMGLSPMVGGFLADAGIFFPYYVAVGLNGLVLILAFFFIKEPTNLKPSRSILKSLKIITTNSKLIIPGTFNFIDRFHMGYILFALPLFILEVLGLDPSMRGIALAIFAAPFILLQYPFGRLSDKYGRFRFLISGSIVYGIILSIIGVIGEFGFVYLVIGLAFLGLFSGISSPANMALVADYTDPEQRAMGMGFFNFMGNLGIVLGPIIGGAILTATDFSWTFIIMGIIEFIGVILAIILLYPKFKSALKRDFNT